MLPHLPTINGDVAGVPVRVPPPPRFRAPSGAIRNVRISKNLQATSKGTTAAQKAGLVYEERVQLELERLFGRLYRRSPWIHFDDDNGTRTCVPDGIVVVEAVPIVIEIKSQHMPEAWWQLRRLYEPVVVEYFKEPVMLLEICKSFDPHMPFPEEPILVYDIREFVRNSPLGSFGVIKWKP